MKITRNVIVDLLPVYFSGEASDDTKILVEQYFKHNPEFASQAKASTEEIIPNNVPITLTEEDEMDTLSKTKKNLKWRSFLMDFAIFFTLVPFSFAYIDGKFHWIISESFPSAIVYVFLAIVCWIGYFITRSKLKMTGI